ncbi:hypothetical protein GWK47_026115 [Chionoecetes opilio]|uniref:Uncharacterized protein n=1 Tax=Chionoecetes opilio TaxID=41210 RepID=A0A8J8WBT9_CHIOP|nr:hypothetical protein GWK47_026115 [Chionoecetes opilio]
MGASTSSSWPSEAYLACCEASHAHSDGALLPVVPCEANVGRQSTEAHHSPQENVTRLTPHRQTTVPPYVPEDDSPLAPPFPFAATPQAAARPREVFL